MAKNGLFAKSPFFACFCQVFGYAFVDNLYLDGSVCGHQVGLHKFLRVSSNGTVGTPAAALEPDLLCLAAR